MARPQHPQLVISSFDGVRAHLARSSFDGILSIGDPGSQPPIGVDVTSPLVLRLELIDELELGIVGGPRRAHLEAITAFGQWFQGTGLSVLVHCRQGVSRSSAAALVLLAQALGAGKEDEAVAALYRCEGGEDVRPNPAMVRLGDAVLERRGRLVRALVGRDG